jgi:hypothetical protein
MVRHGIRRAGQIASLKTGTPEIDRALDAVRDKVNPLLRGAFAQAIVLEASLESGLNKIGHGLGVPVHHFMHAALREPSAIISNGQPENPFPERQLWVRLTNAASADVVLFLLPALG